jgi:spore coat polysaccharide biosynthesis protein SpsF (cytidylyltransferase family)
MDYVSNVDPRFRTSIDGFDVEVMSKKAMHWLSENAFLDEDKEHVTIALRKNKIPGLSYGCIMDGLDFSGMKLSVDTEDDFQNVVKEMRRVREKTEGAKSYYGSRAVYRVYS